MSSTIKPPTFNPVQMSNGQYSVQQSVQLSDGDKLNIDVTGSSASAVQNAA